MGLPRGAELIMGEQLVGTVTRYFVERHVAVVEIFAGELRVGDTIRVAGVQCDFVQPVRSMELEHAPIESAKAGDTISVQLSERVRESTVSTASRASDVFV